MPTSTDPDVPVGPSPARGGGKPAGRSEVAPSSLAARSDVAPPSGGDGDGDGGVGDGGGDGGGDGDGVRVVGGAAASEALRPAGGGSVKSELRKRPRISYVESDNEGRSDDDNSEGASGGVRVDAEAEAEAEADALPMLRGRASDATQRRANAYIDDRYSPYYEQLLSCVSMILRNLTMIKENQAVVANHDGTMQLVMRYLEAGVHRDSYSHAVDALLNIGHRLVLVTTDHNYSQMCAPARLHASNVHLYS